MDKTAEQQARDLLERMGIEDAQSFSNGDVVELANLIADKNKAIAMYQKLERAVYELYYLDNDFGKKWMDGITAVNWLKYQLDTIPQNH